MIQNQISTSNLSFSYHKGNSCITNLNLLVPKGSIYGFLGRNGSGKTTTIRLLLGLLTPQTGEIFFNEQPFQNNRISCLSQIGALIENPFLYDHLSGIENLELKSRYHTNIGKGRIIEVLTMFDLQKVSRVKVRNYSLGMRQRLGLALCILHQPNLLILDEPMNGLDPQGIVELRKLLKRLNSEEGTTIFLSSHLISETEKLCNHYGIIKNGEMRFQGSVEELKNSRGSAVQLEIETNDLKRTNNLVQHFTLCTPIFVNDHLLLSLEDKKNIPLLIDELRKNNIEIYELRQKRNLEEVFLTQTQYEL